MIHDHGDADDDNGDDDDAGDNDDNHIIFCKNQWPIISSVPDTSAPHFGIHRPKM